MDQLPRLGKRELICLLLFTCNYVVSVWRGFLFLWVLGMGYVILLWHSLSLPLIIKTEKNINNHFFHYNSMETFSCPSKLDIDNKSTSDVEANAISMYAKFQLYSPISYGFGV